MAEVEKIKVTEEEFAEAMAQLSKIREPKDMPIEKEVTEMIIRMKIRWGIYG